MQNEIIVVMKSDLILYQNQDIAAFGPRRVVLNTAIRLPCREPVTSRKFICNPDVTITHGDRITVVFIRVLARVST